MGRSVTGNLTVTLRRVFMLHAIGPFVSSLGKSISKSMVLPFILLPCRTHRKTQFERSGQAYQVSFYWSN